MRKMVFLRQLAADQIAQIQAIAPDWTLINGRTAEDWLPHIADAEIIAGWNESVAQTLQSESSMALRWLQNWGAGIDNLPHDFLTTHHVTVTNASGVHAYPISETVLAMMLGLTRKIPSYVRNQQAHTWHNAQMAQEMHRQTVAIIGVGAIGGEVARLCKAFEMRVLGVRRCAQPADNVDEMVGMDGLIDTIGRSDYIVNTLPLTPETRGLFDAAAFEAMKPSAFYINIGRGGTTDEAALVAALQSKQIAGAGIDVFAQEPLPSDSPLWDIDNLILTPHTSGSTTHYNERVLDIFTANLRAYLRGETLPRNRVDLQLQY